MSLIQLRPLEPGLSGSTAPSAPAGPVEPLARPRLRPVLALISVVLLTILTGLALTADSTATGRASGLSDAGALTARLLPASRGIFDLGAVGTVGVLVALAWLVPAGHDGVDRRLRRAAAGWAWLWAAASGAMLLAGVSQVVGVPLLDLADDTDLLWYGVDLPQGRATLLVAVAALTHALWISTVRTRTGYRAWAVAMTAVMGPLLATGHAATASNHFLATQVLLVHVISVTLWAGGLLALVVHVPRAARAAAQPTDLLPTAVARFSRLALPCYLAVGTSGLIGAWTRLGLDPAVWASTYGALLLLKVAVLGGCGLLGWAHRRRSLPALAAGQRGAFLKIAGVEVTLMALGIGLAVILGRTSPPIEAVLRAVPPHAAAFPTVDASLPPLTAVSALVEFRPDALVLTVVLAATGLLAAWLRSGAGRGLGAGRPVLLAAALVLLAWSLVGALGAYATSLLSAQVAQLVVLGLVVPALLVAGLPAAPRAALAARLRAGRLGVLMHPTHALLLLLGLLTATLHTPVLDVALRSEEGHLLLGVAMLAAGLVFSLALAIAGTPVAPSAMAGPLLVLALAVGWYGVLLHAATTPYADGWFDELDLWWADAAADQRLAGLLLIATAGGLLVAATAARRTPTPEATGSPVPVSSSPHCDE